MATKEVRLFDNNNNPLHVNGIRVELFDAITGTLLDAQNSCDLNTSQHPSNTWGVILNFQPVRNPLDIYIHDPSYKYPGNAVKNINGDLNDLIELDLLALPIRTGGQAPDVQRDVESDPTLQAILRWVEDGQNWNLEEKQAVLNLILNYIGVLAPKEKELSDLSGLMEIKQNWGEALEKVGMPPDRLIKKRKMMSDGNLNTWEVKNRQDRDMKQGT